LENRVNDQQPPEEMLTVPALTLGILEALPECAQVLEGHAWPDLRAARDLACREALGAQINGVAVGDLAERMLAAAHQGLERRGKGEEQFLAPLWARLEEGRCPADDAAAVFQRGGVAALVKDRRL
ncbi:MAG: hypothetical protein ACODAJ_05355, partial [Planctomycetota bacterium]